LIVKTLLWYPVWVYGRVKPVGSVPMKKNKTVLGQVIVATVLLLNLFWLPAYPIGEHYTCSGDRSIHNRFTD